MKFLRHILTYSVRCAVPNGSAVSLARLSGLPLALCASPDDSRLAPDNGVLWTDAVESFAGGRR